jgi:serine/threonine protein kinase
VAKIRGGMELTAHNTILGTVPYMAPEQLLGGAVDARTDQFALGSIVYEMLTGKMAFGADTVPAAAARVAHFEPPPIDDIPEPVNRAIMRALSKSAEHRFPTVGAFIQEIVEAASRPEDRDADLEETSGELPPLAGEATMITRSGASASDDDDDDEVAEPPAPREMVITDRRAPEPGWGDTTGPQPLIDGLATTGKVALETMATAVGPGPAGGKGAPSAVENLPSVEVELPEATGTAPTPLESRALPERDPARTQPPSVSGEHSVETTALSRLPPARPGDGETAAVQAPRARPVRTGAGATWLVMIVAALLGAAVGIWLITRH